MQLGQLLALRETWLLVPPVWFKNAQNIQINSKRLMHPSSYGFSSTVRTFIYASVAIKHCVVVWRWRKNICSSSGLDHSVLLFSSSKLPVLLSCSVESIYVSLFKNPTWCVHTSQLKRLVHVAWHSLCWSTVPNHHFVSTWDKLWHLPVCLCNFYCCYTWCEGKKANEQVFILDY